MGRLTIGLLLLTVGGALCTAAAAAEQAAPKGPVYLVVTGLKVDETGQVPAVDPAPGAGAVVTLTPAGGPPQRKAAVPLQARGTTYHTADFAVDFGVAYEVTLAFQGGPTLTVKDYRVSAAWTKVPIFTFNNTTGTTSPAAVLRRERDAATGLGCYIYALWPYENYRAVGGTQLPAPAP